jgi:hypothetical protein
MTQKVTPEELAKLQIVTDFEVLEDLPKGSVGDNVLREQDWEHIMIKLYNSGYEIIRRK